MNYLFIFIYLYTNSYSDQMVFFLAKLFLILTAEAFMPKVQGRSIKALAGALLLFAALIMSRHLQKDKNIKEKISVIGVTCNYKIKISILCTHFLHEPRAPRIARLWLMDISRYKFRRICLALARAP